MKHGIQPSELENIPFRKLQFLTMMAHVEDAEKLPDL